MKCGEQNVSCLIVGLTFLCFAVCYELQSNQRVMKNKTECKPAPKSWLMKELGDAFNPRYMSVVPPELEVVGFEEYRDFYKDADYAKIIYSSYYKNITNWITSPSRNETLYIVKPKNETIAWDCNSRPEWIFLGDDYFPPYIRSVECGRSMCWYDEEPCMPKYFSIKILKKKSGECIGTANTDGVVSGLVEEKMQKWVWVRRPINFICECPT